MKTILAVIGAVVVIFVLILFALCNDDDDNKNSYGPLRLVSAVNYHDGGDCDWDGDCGGGDSYRYDERNGGRGDRRGGDGRYGGGRSGDTNQRGDKNCRNFCGNTIIVPTPPGMGGGTDQPPEERA